MTHKNSLLNFVGSYLSGLIFGIGLLLASMTDPTKVLAFLDITGTWDPSLMLVMVGAISISMLGYRLIRVYNQTLCGSSVQIPTKQTLDLQLISGSLLFGVGWGLTGICPGPAIIVGIASLLQHGISAIWIFLAAMLLGMALFEVLQLHSQRSTP